MTPAIFALTLALAGPPAGVAAALPNESWRACAEGTAEAAVSACGAIIHSNQGQAALLALAHYNRANAHFRQAQFARANLPNPKRAEASLRRSIQDYTAAIRLDPDLAEAWVNRGIAWYDAGVYDRAVTDATQAIRLKPGLAEAHNNRSLAYHKLGSYALALRDFDETIRLEKNYGNALINRAMPSLVPPP